MRSAILALSGVMLSACGSTPDDDLLRLASQLSDLAHDCVGEVIADVGLLDSDACRNYVDQNNLYLSQLGDRQAAYEESFEFQARGFMGWPREIGYFPCDKTCWQARSHANSAAYFFKHAMMLNLGCGPGGHYYDTGFWDEIRDRAELRSCESKTERAND